MIKVTFIESNGTEHAVEGASGQSLMQVAADNLIPGVTAEGGGFLNCATCHVYIDEAWFSGLPAVEEEEQELIESAFHVQANSRLSCQVELPPELEGVVVRIPASQTS